MLHGLALAPSAMAVFVGYDANAVAGMLTLARSEELLTKSKLRSRRLMMARLTQATRLGMSQCPTPRLLPESEIRLTEQECAVLRWTGDGKTVSDIPEVMRISESTVNLHIRNAVAKLGAVNELAATVKAAMPGTLH